MPTIGMCKLATEARKAILVGVIRNCSITPQTTLASIMETLLLKRAPEILPIPVTITHLLEFAPRAKWTSPTVVLKQVFKCPQGLASGPHSGCWVLTPPSMAVGRARVRSTSWSPLGATLLLLNLLFTTACRLRRTNSSIRPTKTPTRPMAFTSTLWNGMSNRFVGTSTASTTTPSARILTGIIITMA